MQLTPILFNLWEEWAQQYEDEKNSLDNTSESKQNTTIRAMGEHIAPDWVIYEFKNLEEFYKHYTELLNVGDKDGG